MGEKMTPATPVMVNKGRKELPMIRVENAIGGPTSWAAASTRSFIDPLPWGPRWRKMFSIMMTEESTTMPKSKAPQRDEIGRGVGKDEPSEGTQQGQRNDQRGDERRPHVAQKDQQNQRHQHDAGADVLHHRAGGQRHQLAAVVVGLDLHARGQDVVLANIF